MHLVIEGPDGSGKTTVCSNLMSLLKKQGIPARYYIHPGATSLGMKVREIVKDPSIKANGFTRQILMAADYNEFVHSELNVNISEGVWSISDRCNIVSGLIYGVCGGCDRETLWNMQNLSNSKFHLVVLCTDLITALKRRGSNNVRDYFEENDVEYQRNVLDLYNRLASGDTSGCFSNMSRFLESLHSVDANDDPGVVAENVFRIFQGIS